MKMAKLIWSSLLPIVVVCFTIGLTFADYWTHFRSQWPALGLQVLALSVSVASLVGQIGRLEDRKNDTHKIQARDVILGSVILLAAGYVIATHIGHQKTQHPTKPSSLSPGSPAQAEG